MLLGHECHLALQFWVVEAVVEWTCRLQPSPGSCSRLCNSIQSIVIQRTECPQSYFRFSCEDEVPAPKSTTATIYFEGEHAAPRPARLQATPHIRRLEKSRQLAFSLAQQSMPAPTKKKQRTHQRCTLTKRADRHGHLSH